MSKTIGFFPPLSKAQEQLSSVSFVPRSDQPGGKPPVLVGSQVSPGESNHHQ